MRKQLEEGTNPVVIDVSEGLANFKGHSANKSGVGYRFAIGRESSGYLRHMIRRRQLAGEPVDDESWLFRRVAKPVLTPRGKTYLAMHLAMEAAKEGIDCLVIDPHAHFKLLPKRERITVEYPADAARIVELLQSVYTEALKQPIEAGEPKLRKLVIIDEISAGKFSLGIKKIIRILDSCFSELRKFGYGFIIICTYATEDRGITPTIRENSETLFIFRKKTVNELERISTLKHPNMNLIPYLGEGFFMVYSEDFHSEPFFVKSPRIDNMLSKKQVYTNSVISYAPAEPTGNVKCGMCGYEWEPRKPIELIEQCPRCRSRRWNEGDATMSS